MPKSTFECFILCINCFGFYRYIYVYKEKFNPIFLRRYNFARESDQNFCKAKILRLVGIAKIRPISEVFLLNKNEPESPQFLLGAEADPSDAHLCEQKKMTCWGVKCIGESDSAGNGNVSCHFRSLAVRQYF